ncbi:MAG: tail fiber domain-containing protein [Saprospiraceae bacterium]|nr:tail fiber domain-containing protein [Saprospiraceae bacterium]
MKRIWLPFVLSSAFFALTAQNPLAEVQGRMSVYLADDTTSLHIGKRAGINQQSGMKRNTFIGTHAGRTTNGHYDNTIIGYKAGMILDGNLNSFFGSEAGNESTGGSNAFFGNLCGQTNNGWYNSFFGAEAGTTNNGSYNCFFGFEAGYVNTGQHNCLFGFEAGLNNDSGSHNIYIGSRTATFNQTGSHNIALGSVALMRASTKSHNVAVGDSSMYNIGANDSGINQLAAKNVAVGVGSLWGKVDNTGSRSVALGYKAGYDGGNNSIFIGNEAGKNASVRNNALYVSNQAGDNPLIYGEFDNNLLQVNGSLYIGGVGNNSKVVMANQGDLSFYTSGGNEKAILSLHSDDNTYLDAENNIIFRTAPGTTSRMRIENDGDVIISSLSGAGVADLQVESDGRLIRAPSDLRLKKDIATLDNALAKVLQLRGVSYNWKNKSNSSKTLGLIAQEVLQVLPEVVTSDGKYYGVNYSELPAILIEAIKEQQAIIESQQKQIDQILSMMGSPSQ